MVERNPVRAVIESTRRLVRDLKTTTSAPSLEPAKPSRRISRRGALAGIAAGLLLVASGKSRPAIAQEDSPQEDAGAPPDQVPVDPIPPSPDITAEGAGDTLEVQNDEGLKIVFGPKYDGQNDKREEDARTLLSIIWQSASRRGSKTLADRATFFIKNTTNGPSPRQFDGFRDKVNGRMETVGAAMLEVRAPELALFETNNVPEMPVNLRIGIYPGTSISDNDGKTRDIILVLAVVLVGDTNYQFNPNSMEAYAQYLLLPNAFAAMTNIAMRSLIVRQGVHDLEEVKVRVGGQNSDFHNDVRAKAWDRMFIDTRNIFQETPDTWEKKDTYYRKYYNEWLLLKTEDERITYIKRKILKI